MLDDLSAVGLTVGWHEHDGVPWFAATGDGWQVVFSTREGGISQGPFASLNVGYSVGDDPTAVGENRRRLCAAVGVQLADVVVPGQVHGTHIAVVEPEHRGRGAYGRDDVLHETDGLLTEHSGVVLMVSFADCVPVLVVARHPRRRARIALVHAGWRGMLAGIVEKAARMVSAHSSAETGAPELDLVAAVIGPSIGPCCFTVSRDVGEKFARAFPGTYVPYGADGGPVQDASLTGPTTGISRGDGHVDLWRAAELQLAAAGLDGSRIVNPHLCTSCDTRFYSHRRDGGRTGRQAALAWLSGSDTRVAHRHG